MRLISCENTYFLEVFADGTATIPYFLGFEDPAGRLIPCENQYFLEVLADGTAKIS